ncbi:hypothetical protein [Carboxylicivirga sp. RSCT41]|uniref:hypothetical protein n=1 Tax=Carboxylicivirga agarovorans TaxID=3417570 RepID=UPI003D334E23
MLQDIGDPMTSNEGGKIGREGLWLMFFLMHIWSAFQLPLKKSKWETIKAITTYKLECCDNKKARQTAGPSIS